LTATLDLAQILVRRDTSANWTLANILLASGEIGYETDTHLLKIGDGSTLWNSLGYLSAEIAGQIHLAPAKTTPIDADEFALVDTAASNIIKKLTWANIKATLKSYFDPIYTSILSYTTTATAGATTVLTAASTFWQFFTGTLNQTITLPVTSTLGLGQPFTEITNNSTGVLTVNSSGGNLVLSMPAGTVAIFEVILTSGTTAASWNADFIGASTLTGTGAAVLNISPSITDPKITRLINAQTGTAYTFVLADVEKEVTTSNAAAVAASIPTNASVNYPVGATIYGKNKGAGLLTIAAVTPGATTVLSQGTVASAPTIAQYGSWKATQILTDVWYVTGDVVKSSGAAPTFATGYAYVATAESTSSTTYTDMATVLSTTVVTGTKALVIVSAALNNNTTASVVSYMGFSISGATTRAASDEYAASLYRNDSTMTKMRFSAAFVVTGLTAGSNVFTAKYRMGAGGNPCYAELRNIEVIDLGS
jgi:Major tropism determinant N-terminal domain